MSMIDRNARVAFSLVELLVTLSVLALLMGLLLSAVQTVRGAAKRAECSNNMRNIGLAMHSYHTAHGCLPPMRIRSATPGQPEILLGWLALILPMVDSQNIYDDAISDCKLMPSYRDIYRHRGFGRTVKVFGCPADDRYGTQAQLDRNGHIGGVAWYVGVAGYIDTNKPVQWDSLGAFAGSGIPLDAIHDGTSHTLLVGERPPPANLQAGWWYPKFVGDATGNYGPNNQMYLGEIVPFYAQDECVVFSQGFGPGRLENPCDRYHFWSLHRNGGNWLFADGSVRFHSYKQTDILRKMASYAGNEIISE
jgi:prepilin-type processing-associated H-X9-DG protein